MLTRLQVVEKLLDKAQAHATDKKWPGHEEIPKVRKTIREKYGSGFLVDQIEAKCGSAFDNGHLADYIDKEFLSYKAGAILNGSAKPGSPMALWNPTPEDKAFAVDILAKIFKVMRA